MALDFVGLFALGSVLTLLFIAILYFMKVDPDDHLMANGQLKVKETPVLRVKRPFELSLVSQQSNSLQDGVSIAIKTEFECEIHQFWGVFAKSFLEVNNIHPFKSDQKSSQRSKKAVMEILEQSSFFHRQDNTENVQWTTALKPLDDSLIYIQNVAPSTAQERILIPLVVLLTCRADNMKSDLVSSIYFLTYEKQPDGRVTWKIPHEFLQTVNGDVFRVQSIFESGIPQNELELSESSLATASDAMCIICHHLQVTRVLLPCRHFCLCAACFHRVRQCPVCRCQIGSYLKLGDESQVVLDGFQEPERDVRNQLRTMSASDVIRAIWNAG